MKSIYTAPRDEEIAICTDLLAASMNAGSWEDSISGTGSRWGGTATDDSIYGL